MTTLAAEWIMPSVHLIDAIGQMLVQIVVAPIPPSVVTNLFFILGVAGHPLTLTGVLCVICLIELFRHRDSVAVFYIAAVSVTWVVVNTLKYFIGRGRPQLVDSFLIFANGSSFPSGHTAMSTVVYGYVIWLLYKRYSRAGRQAGNRGWNMLRFTLAALLSILIVMIGFSRVYEGVHWFSDVLAGWGAGAIVIATVVLISRVREKGQEAI